VNRGGTPVDEIRLNSPSKVLDNNQGQTLRSPYVEPFKDPGKSSTDGIQGSAVVELDVVLIQVAGSLQIRAFVENQMISTLVDSGAAISFVQENLVKHLKHEPVIGLILRTANNSPLRIHIQEATP
jgi:hypothetical protein